MKKNFHFLALYFLVLFCCFTNQLKSQCTYYIELTDTYGDGWDGGIVAVSVNGSVVLSNLGSTFTSGFTGPTSSFSASSGQTVRVYLTTAGSYPSEMRIRVFNSSGTNIINTIQPPTGTATTGGVTGTVSCASSSYCIPSVTNSCREFINAVNLGSIQNNSGCTSGGYADYSSRTANLTKGSQYTLDFSLSVGSSQNQAYTYDEVAAWIDYNGDFVFSSNERVGYLYITSNYSSFFNFTVPNSAITGPVRMRIRISYKGTNGPSIDPCSTLNYGETEDYTINISSVSPSSISASSNNICPGTPVNLTAVGGTGGINWYVGSCGSGSYVGTGSNISVSPITTTTYFARSSSSSSNCVSITIYVVNNPNTPGNPSSNSPQCNSVTISRLSSPPNGETWYWQGTDPNGTSTSLGSGATYTANSSGNYYIRAQNSSGCWSTWSGGVAVTVNSAPISTINLISNSPQCNSAVSIIRTNILPSGSTWYWQGTNQNGTSTSLGNAFVYTATTSGTYYIRARSNLGCWSANSLGIPVTVATPPTAPLSVTGNSTICSGASTTLTATGGSEGSDSNYEWFTTACGTNVIGTDANLNVSPIVTTTYFVRRKGNAPCNVTTDCVSFTVNVIPAPTAPTLIMGNDSLCLGESTTLTVSGGSDGSGANFEWFASTCGSSIIGSTSTISVNPSSTTTYYVRRKATSSCNNVTTSCVSFTVNVTNLPAATVSPSGNQFLCLNNNLTLSANTGNGLSYQWTLDGNIIPNANSFQFLPQSGGQYGVIITNNAGCTSTSNLVNVTQINPIINGNTAICPGDTVRLSVNGISNYTYAWQLNGNPIVGAQDTVLRVTAPGNYSVITTNPSGCSGISSVNVTTVSLPNVNIQSNGSTSICSNEILNLSSVQFFQNYQWLFNGQAIANAQLNNLNVNSTGTYALYATDSNGCSNVSNSIFVNVRPAPNLSVSQIGSLEFCQGDSLVLSSSSSFGNIWSNGEINQSITILNSGIYSLTLTDGICSATSQDYVVNVYQIPVILLSDTVVDVNTGNNAMLSSSNAVNNALFQWQMFQNGLWNNISESSNFSGTASRMLTVYNLDLSYHNREFRLLAANGFCYDTSATVRLNVSNINTAVNNVESELFEVYPNPFSEVLFVNVINNKNISNCISIIYDNIGQVMNENPLSLESNEIIFEKNWPSGMYFLVIMNKDKKVLYRTKVNKL